MRLKAVQWSWAIAWVVWLTVPLWARGETEVAATVNLDHLLDVVEIRYRAAPDPSDVRAQARELEYDAHRIIAFVQHEVAFEPYRGILRGASGTLFARAGNAMDQALLLRELLMASGISSHIVTRDLAFNESALLLQMFLERPPVPPNSPPNHGHAARSLGVEEEAVESVVQQRSRSDQGLIEEVLEGAQREYARLRDLFAERLQEAAFDAPKMHYWVEIEDEAVDPVGGGLDPGTARTVDEAELQAARRTIVFRLELDRVMGGETQTEELLQVVLPADEIAHRPVDLVILPEEGELPSLATLLFMTPQERSAAFLDVEKFRCGLMVDRRTYGGAPFDRAGRVFEVTRDGRVDAARGVGEAVTGVFGGALGRRDVPVGRLEALRLEIIVQSPGSLPQSQTRTLYEAGGNRYPMLRDSFLVETHLLPPGESARRYLGVLSRHAGAIRHLLIGGRPRGELRPESEVAPMLLRYADFRRRMVASVAALPLYEDLGIMRESRQLLVDPETHVSGERHLIDLMMNRLSFLSADGTYARETAMHLGVAETALEWLLLVRTNPVDADTDGSAWTLMERARIHGHAARIVDEGEIWKVQWADDAWWSVHPITGHVVGRAHDGAGQAMIEYAWKASGSICKAMNPYFSLMKEFDVQAESLTNIEQLCSLHGILSSLGGDVEGVLDKGADDFIRDKIKGKIEGKIPSAEDFQQKLFDYIQKQTRAMWGQAANALAGF